MIDVFNASIPDFDFDRFEEWIEHMRSSRDVASLLHAPLCTAHPDSYPPVKVTCVVGEELMQPVDEPATDAPTTKGKEEAHEEDAAPLYVNAVWKFTEEELMDIDVYPAINALEQIAKANALIPVVGEGGKRVQADQQAAKPEAQKAPAVVKGKCSHETFRTREGEVRECVCQWTPPKQKFQEDGAAYKSRLIKWKQLRNATAKKRGIKLAD